MSVDTGTVTKTRKVVVFHAYYGCDTGCCGHFVKIVGPDGTEVESEFEFAHPYGDDPIEWAKAQIRETFGDDHVADLDWENCEIVDD